MSAGRGRRRAGGGGVRTRVSRIGGIESRASSLLRGSVPPAGETRRGGEGDASSGEVAIGRNESPNAASVCERPRARELRFKLRTFRLELKRPRAQGPSFSSSTTFFGGMVSSNRVRGGGETDAAVLPRGADLGTPKSACPRRQCAVKCGAAAEGTNDREQRAKKSVRRLVRSRCRRTVKKQKVRTPIRVRNQFGENAK